jgi:hypothetical protein
VASTLEKITELVRELEATPPAELGAEGRDLAEALQILAGLGIDPLGMLLPKSEPEADVLVDNLIVLLLSIRGDDLPPFDPGRYGEAAISAAPPDG